MNSTVELKVEGMTCQGCVRGVTKKLSGVAGVASAVVDLEAAKATVQYDDSLAKVDDLIGAVEQIGFHAARIGNANEAH
jgi:copper chaperone CopZ